MYIGDKDDNDTQRFVLELKPSNGGEQLIIFGINPSTAQGKYPFANLPANYPKETDDQTMKRVCSFVKRNSLGGKKFDGFLMFNVCAQRSTNPKKLIKNDNLHKMNLEKIRTHLTGKNDIYVWLAFGNNIGSQKGWVFDYFKDIVKLLKDYNSTYIHLGDFTAKNNPKHPSRVPDGTPFKEFTKKNSPSKWDFLF